ncbi:hypothetical protein [Neopusillimonas aromaticivorans]|uniref:hypothetical protein n=1 Tax=Neopusillimonas aromaticivorans TaxID=2979868 RepID=UPI002595B38A|nr:hypothetical protein [Neopusillimonas aromaticivorans]WJJ94234.1 hypothetical protein N7E01_04025 [Neopusillimonas aromaticivorans]
MDAYEWLERSIKRLCFATLWIKTKKYSFHPDHDTGALHLIIGFDHDSKSGDYRVFLDPRLALLFTNHEFTRIDWEQRLRISSNRNMSKFLQRLVGSSADVDQAYSLEFLKSITRYGGQNSKFEKSVLEGLVELERVGLVSNPRIQVGRDGRKFARWSRSYSIDKRRALKVKRGLPVVNDCLKTRLFDGVGVLS